MPSSVFSTISKSYLDKILLENSETFRKSGTKSLTLDTLFSTNIHLQVAGERKDSSTKTMLISDVSSTG